MNSSLCHRRSSCPFSSRSPPRLQSRDWSALASRRTESSSSHSSSRRTTTTVPRVTMPASGGSDALAAAAAAAPATTSASAPSLTAVSWDIDGTLLKSKGDVANKLHHRAFSHAWKETYNLDFHIREIPHQGSTDPLILLSGVREAVARLRKEIGGEKSEPLVDGPSPSSSSSPSPSPPPRLYSHEEAFALLKDAERAMTSFYEAAATDAAVAAEGLELLPGVEALLAELARRENVVQGLVTGNLQPIGWRKVETLGVAHHFDEIIVGSSSDGEGEEEDEKAAAAAAAATKKKRRVGGFGSDHCSEAEAAIDEPWRDRARFIEIAAERALQTAAAAAADSSANATIARKVHIGDTPFDLKAAAAAGALPVGVATGIFSKEELAAAGVPGAVILDDLSDLEASLRAMGFSD